MSYTFSTRKRWFKKGDFMKLFTEEEWFDTFYPKEFGNWREGFNIAKYRENPEATGCSRMNYCISGYLSCENSDGFMALNKYPPDASQEHFFVECGYKSDDKNIAWFIQPYFQKKDDTYYASVKISKMESNLDIYIIYISGCDDCSYTKHFVGKESLNKEVLQIKERGILDSIELVENGYFFTN